MGLLTFILILVGIAGLLFWYRDSIANFLDEF